MTENNPKKDPRPQSSAEKRAQASYLKTLSEEAGEGFDPQP
jgi:hypothetical protein